MSAHLCVEYEFSVRASNLLEAHRIETLEDLAALTESRIVGWTRGYKRMLREYRVALAKYDLKFTGEPVNIDVPTRKHRRGATAVRALPAALREIRRLRAALRNFAELEMQFTGRIPSGVQIQAAQAMINAVREAARKALRGRSG